MLDIKTIREQQPAVTDSIRRRGLKADVAKLLKLDEERRRLVGESEALRSKLKVEGKPSAAEQVELKQVKQQYDQASKQLAKVESAYNDLLQQVPNLIAEDTPDGDESSNRIEKEAGTKPKFDFEPKDHISLAEANGWADFERGAKVAGNKFYFLKGPVVKLELAVMRMALDLLEAKGFTPMITPHMVRGEIAEGTGFTPRGEEDQEYRIEGEDLTLIATAEVSLTGYHANEILEDLPQLYAGLTPSYRKEAGTYGKHSKGLYRVHQFDKLEMYVYCQPADSQRWLEDILQIEETICEQLKIPYRVVRIAARDLSAPAYKKYDIEYWSPVDGTYRELTSCSNCTDYQARNLNIRVKTKTGTEFAHTLNGTAVAFSRVLIALLENHQQPDGSVKIPPKLKEYYGSPKI
jgi:seryl-tRNA synthetase